MRYLVMASPFGPLTLFEEDGALVAMEWGRGPKTGSPSLLLEEARRQLDAYFDGRLTKFDLPLHPRGTPFQKTVWRALCRIPYGVTRSYGELASRLDTAPRAVGGACGRNPVPIIIPCHRVVDSRGGLTGYSGGQGLETKRALLRLEGLSLD